MRCTPAQLTLLGLVLAGCSHLPPAALPPDPALLDEAGRAAAYEAHRLTFRPGFFSVRYTRSDGGYTWDRIRPVIDQFPVTSDVAKRQGTLGLVAGLAAGGVTGWYYVPVGWPALIWGIAGVQSLTLPPPAVVEAYNEDLRRWYGQPPSTTVWISPAPSGRGGSVWLSLESGFGRLQSEDLNNVYGGLGYRSPAVAGQGGVATGIVLSRFLRLDAGWTPWRPKRFQVTTGPGGVDQWRLDSRVWFGRLTLIAPVSDAVAMTVSGGVGWYALVSSRLTSSSSPDPANFRGDAWGGSLGVGLERRIGPRAVAFTGVEYEGAVIDPVRFSGGINPLYAGPGNILLRSDGRGAAFDLRGVYLKAGWRFRLG